MCFYFLHMVVYDFSSCDKTSGFLPNFINLYSQNFGSFSDFFKTH